MGITYILHRGWQVKASMCVGSLGGQQQTFALTPSNTLMATMKAPLLVETCEQTVVMCYHRDYS